MVGGKDFSQSQFNRAVQAKRQPGSSFKLFVYTAALDSGWSPTSRVLDAPLSFPGANGHERGFHLSSQGIAILAQMDLNKQDLTDSLKKKFYH